MLGPKLNIKFKDALKMIIKQSWLGIVLAIGFAIYSGHLRADNAPIIIAGFCFCFIFSSFILANSGNGTLTTDGILFKEPFKDEKTIEWHQITEAGVTSKKYPHHVFIKCEGKNKPISVHKDIFSYAEISDWIKKNSPENHSLREFCK